MRIDIAAINRINTCGILNKNNWDHDQKLELDPSYMFGIKELLKWHYKRGNPVEHETFTISLSTYNALNRIDHEKRVIFQQAFREFIQSHFYQTLSNVYFNYRSDFKVSKEDYLEYIIPIFINDINKPMFINYDLGKQDKDFFLQRYETMHNAIWSFYQLNKLPTFVNIWFENNKINHEFYKVNEDYILKAKKHFITIGKNLNMFVLPTIQTCKTCIKIKDCERFSNKKTKRRKPNGQN